MKPVCLHDPICITSNDGTQMWYLNGQRHRIDGPAITWVDGSQEWCVNGDTHRLDGPAYIDADGTQEWYLNGKRHRLDGPACISAYADQKWYINGENITKKVESWIKEYDIPVDYTTWTYNHRILFRLRF